MKTIHVIVDIRRNKSVYAFEDSNDAMIRCNSLNAEQGHAFHGRFVIEEIPFFELATHR